MATTEEIVAKYRLDLDELKTQVAELQAQFKKVDEGAKNSASGVDKAFGKLGDQLKKLGTAVVAAFAAEKIFAFGKSAVLAFAEAEQGALKLQAAVAGAGGLTQDFETLNNQAEELAQRTIFDDDTIRAAQTLALQFGLNSKAVSELIPKVADFAAATGQDLQAALQGVIGGINGQEKALKGYGITLDGTNSRNERLVAITEQITNKFNGQAEALTNTLGGAIGQAEKAYDNLTETIGEALAPAITAAATGITDLFESLGTPPNEQAIIDEIANLELLQASILDATTTQEDRNKAIDELQKRYPDYFVNLNKEKLSNEDIRKVYAAINEELIDNLVIKQQGNAVDEKRQALQEARAKVAELEGKAATLLVEARQLGITVEERYVTIQQRAARALELLRLRQDDLGKSGVAARVKVGTLIQTLEATTGEGTFFSDGLVTAYRKVTEAEKALDKQQVTRVSVLRELGLNAANYRRVELEAIQELAAGGDELAKKELTRRKQQDELDKLSLEQFKKLSAERQQQIANTLETTVEAIVKAKTTGLEGLTDEEKKAAAERQKNLEKEQAERAKALQQAATEEAKRTEQLRADELKTSQEYLDLYLADQTLAIQQRYQAERNAAQAEAQRQQQDLVRQLEQGLITREDYEKKKAAIVAAIPNTEGQQALEQLQLEARVLTARLGNLQDYTVDREALLRQAAELQATLAAATAAQSPAEVARLENERAALEERLALIQFEADERLRIQQELAQKEQALAAATEPAVVTSLQAERQALQDRLALLTTDASQRLELEQQLTQKIIALDAARARRDPAYLQQLEQERAALAARLETLQQDAEQRVQLEQQLAAQLAAIDTTTDPLTREQLAAEAAALQERLRLFQTNAAERLKVEQELATKTAALRAAAATDPAAVAQLEQDKRVLEERLKLTELSTTDRAKLEQELAAKTAAIDAQRTKNEQDQSALRTANAEKETSDKLDQLAKEAQARKDFNKALQELSVDLADQVFAFAQQESDQRAEALQKEKDERLKYYDEQQADLQDQYEKRLIGAQEFEAASQQIAQQRVATEKSIDAQVKEIRRKQDTAKKAQALYNIVVDTAAAIQAQLKTTPLPAGAPLVALIAASGLAQAGIVLSQKPPQYAEGVDYVPLGKNKKGRDTIPALLDEGERVISRKKNLRHWDLYTAIDQDRLPQFIFQTYTLPVLQRERDRSREVFHQLNAAVQRQTDTFTLGPATTSATADAGELRRLWRRGLAINNLDELAALLAKNQPSPYRA